MMRMDRVCDYSNVTRKKNADRVARTAAIQVSARAYEDERVHAHPRKVCQIRGSMMYRLIAPFRLAHLALIGRILATHAAAK